MRSRPQDCGNWYSVNLPLFLHNGLAVLPDAPCGFDEERLAGCELHALELAFCYLLHYATSRPEEYCRHGGSLIVWCAVSV